MATRLLACCRGEPGERRRGGRVRAGDGRHLRRMVRRCQRRRGDRQADRRLAATTDRRDPCSSSGSAPAGWPCRSPPRGSTCVGVDASPAMLARLRAKPGGADIPVTLADMAGPEPPGPFALVLVAYNTLFNLTTADAQQKCISNAAARLSPGRPPGDRGVRARPRRARLGGSHHPLRRPGESRSLGEPAPPGDADCRRRIRRGFGHRCHPSPVEILYATTDQLDTMATRAGLTREGRWADWSDAPFSPDSNHHVTSYLQLDRYSG